LGADPEHVIEEAGLDPRLFDHPDNLIAVGALGRLLLLCVERTRCPHFGLLVGQKSTLESLRAVGMLMRYSDTLGDAIRSINDHLRIQHRGAVTQLEVEGDVAWFSYSLYDPSGSGAIQIIDGALATAIQVFRELCGPDLTPTEVLIPRKPPVDASPYHALYRAPVRFNQESGVLVFPAHWLERRIPGAAPIIRRALELQIVGYEDACPPDLKDELRRLLRAELVKARSNASEVARRLSIHRRTLNRHLRAEGTGFKTLADEVRFLIARQLLEDTDLPLIDIAAVLDFSEPAAFTRAFHRWSGTTPSTWRADTRKAEARALITHGR
jgi:AraC-like DNA-binding protein